MYGWYNGPMGGPNGASGAGRRGGRQSGGSVRAVSETTSRDRLLEAAIAAIESGGEVAVRVDEVADAAAVAKPSLYHHFGDREGLIAAAQAERYRRTLLVDLEPTIRALEACTSAPEAQAIVRDWLATFSSAEGTRRRRIRQEVLGSSVSRPGLAVAVAETNARATADLSRFVELLQERGWATTAFGAETIARWFHGLWNGRYLAELTGDPADAGAWDELTATLVLAMLSPDFGAA